MKTKVVKGRTHYLCPRCGKWGGEADFYFRSSGAVYAHRPCERERSRGAKKEKSAKS